MHYHAIYHGWIHFSYILIPERRKFIWFELESYPGPLASQATSLTTRPCLLVLRVPRSFIRCKCNFNEGLWVQKTIFQALWIWVTCDTSNMYHEGARRVFIVIGTSNRQNKPVCPGHWEQLIELLKFERYSSMMFYIDLNKTRVVHWVDVHFFPAHSGLKIQDHFWAWHYS